MVRRRTIRSNDGSSYPRARGDGPLNRKNMNMKKKLSPRPWGWSVPIPRRTVSAEVFPSRVGMVRDFPRMALAGLSFPLARGDGPGARMAAPLPVSLSPRAWGWSVNENVFDPESEVIPSRVGMVRRSAPGNLTKRSYPRARGDGP